MQLFLGILLLVMSIFLVIAVLMQNGKSKRLSGSIAGGAETFFGKSKAKTIDSVLSKITTVVAILFVLVVIVVYVAFGSTYNEDELLAQLQQQIQTELDKETTEDEGIGATEGEETPEGSETAEGEDVPEADDAQSGDNTEGETTESSEDVAE